MSTSNDQQPSDEAHPGLATLVDATAGRVAAIGLGLGSFLRRRRVFHPFGLAFEATLTVEPHRVHGAQLLDDPASHRGIVRLSRGIGLPEGTQDILGIGLRVVDHADRTVQDLLFATVAGDGAATRHVLAPAPSFAHRPFSTILPYRTRRGLVSLTLHAAENEARGLSTLEASADAFEARELTFVLRATEPGVEPTHVGRLSADRRLSHDESENLRFNPFNASPDLQPAGTLNALRRRAYRASQAVRPRQGWSAQHERT